MNQDDVEAVVQKGETRRFRPLHELLGIPVETSEDAINRLMRLPAKAVKGGTKDE
jgi:hypothetical protein